MARLTLVRVEELLERIRSLHAVVAGDLMVDRYVTGVVDRVSPEAPVPVVRVEEERTAIGGAGNVAANIAALGAGCSVIGCVGDDADGNALCAAFAERGIDISGLVVTPKRPTTVKTRVMAATCGSSVLAITMPLLRSPSVLFRGFVPYYLKVGP